MAGRILDPHPASQSVCPAVTLESLFETPRRLCDIRAPTTIVGARPKILQRAHQQLLQAKSVTMRAGINGCDADVPEFSNHESRQDDPTPTSRSTSPPIRYDGKDL